MSTINNIKEVPLDEATRRTLESLLDRYAADDFEGALVAQISRTGQFMTVLYIDPEYRADIHGILKNSR